MFCRITLKQFTEAIQKSRILPISIVPQKRTVTFFCISSIIWPERGIGLRKWHKKILISFPINHWMFSNGYLNSCTQKCMAIKNYNLYTRLVVKHVEIQLNEIQNAAIKVKESQLSFKLKNIFSQSWNPHLTESS